VTREVDQSYVN